jgi:hypothetical protein
VLRKKKQQVLLPYAAHHHIAQTHISTKTISNKLNNFNISVQHSFDLRPLSMAYDTCTHAIEVQHLTFKV